MNQETVAKEILTAIENELSLRLGKQANIQVKEIIKANDEKLHGLNLNLPDITVAPIIYLENCLADHEKGMPIKAIAQKAAHTMVEGMNLAPCMKEVSMEYEDIKDKLLLQLVEESRNKNWLRNLIHKPVGNGFAMIAYAVIAETEKGKMRIVISKDMANNCEYDVDKMFRKAAENTQKNYPPVLIPISRILSEEIRTDGGIDLRKESPDMNANEGLYILSNRQLFNGANTIFYPHVQQKVGELLNDNYYVLPSSIHEVLIVPKKLAPSLKELQTMVKETNMILEPQKILSDRVFLYDKERDRLIEPVVREKTGEERDER